MRPNEIPQQHQQQQRWPTAAGKKKPSIIKIYFIPFSLASVRQPPPLLPPINGQLPRV
jgi:hypothetical protein